MATTNEIKQELSAIGQIKQITNAMYLLSVASARKGISNIAINDRYMHSVRQAMRDIVSVDPEQKHEFIDNHSGTSDRAAFVILGGDKGLCGGYNANLLRRLLSEMQKHRECYIICSGKRMSEMLLARDIHIDEDLSVAGGYPKIHYARVIASHLLEMLKNDEISEANIIFTDYVTAAEQIVRCVTLFPLEPTDFTDEKGESRLPADTIFEENEKKSLDVLVPQYAVGYIYGALCNAYTSEHYARMNAMQEATRNADEMITLLGTKFNEARQLAITNELVEIASATTLYEEKSI